MHAYSRAQDATAALELLDNLQARPEMPPDVITYTCAVSACGTEWQKALTVLREASSHRVPLGTLAFSKAISAVVEAGEWQEACNLLSEMTAQDLPHNPCARSPALFRLLVARPHKHRSPISPISASHLPRHLAHPPELSSFAPFLPPSLLCTPSPLPPRHTLNLALSACAEAADASAGSDPIEVAAVAVDRLRDVLQASERSQARLASSGYGGSRATAGAPPRAPPVDRRTVDLTKRLLSNLKLDEVRVVPWWVEWGGVWERNGRRGDGGVAGQGGHAFARARSTGHEARAGVAGHHPTGAELDAPPSPNPLAAGGEGADDRARRARVAQAEATEDQLRLDGAWAWRPWGAWGAWGCTWAAPSFARRASVGVNVRRPQLTALSTATVRP